MSIISINERSIESITSISCGQISKIQSLPELFQAQRIFADASQLPDESARTIKNSDIIIIKRRLDKLQNNLDNYNPSLIRWIIDFFTLRFFKIWRLRRSLPEVIRIVNIVYNKVMHPQAPPGGLGIDLGVAKVENQPPKVVVKPKIILPPHLEAKLEYCQKVLREINDDVTDHEDYYLRYRTRNEAEGKKVSAEEIKKLKEKDKALLSKRKIKLFFEKSIERIEKGKNTCIPRFFHATSKTENVASILKSKNIEQRRANWGFGAFVSTGNEGEGEGAMSYGSYSFGIDEDSISDAKAFYYPSFNGKLKTLKETIWACVKKNIPISRKFGFCMAANFKEAKGKEKGDIESIGEVCQALAAKGYNPRLLDEKDTAALQGHDVVVFNYDECADLRNYMDHADVNRQLPKEWYLFRELLSRDSNWRKWEQLQKRANDLGEALPESEREELEAIKKANNLPQNLRHDEFILKTCDDSFQWSE